MFGLAGVLIEREENTEAEPGSAAPPRQVSPTR